MSFTVLLRQKGSETDELVKQVMDEFIKECRIAVKDVHAERLNSVTAEYAENYGTLYRIEVSIADKWSKEAHHEELVYSLCQRLIVIGLEKGFTPLDESGEVIHIFEAYTFGVVFDGGKSGRAAELAGIIEQINPDMPEDNEIRVIPYHDGDRELLLAVISMQDYRSKNEMDRLMYSVYLKLLLLTAKSGFSTVVLPQELSGSLGSRLSELLK